MAASPARDRVIPCPFPAPIFSGLLPEDSTLPLHRRRDLDQAGPWRPDGGRAPEVLGHFCSRRSRGPMPPPRRPVRENATECSKRSTP